LTTDVQFDMIMSINNCVYESPKLSNTIHGGKPIYINGENMKRLLFSLSISLLLLLSACQKKEAFNRVDANGDTRTQSSAENGGLWPAVTPTEPAIPDEVNNEEPSGNAPSEEDAGKHAEEGASKYENYEDKYKTGKFTGPLVHGVTSDMLKPSFWIDQYDGADKILMTYEMTEQYNKKNLESLPFLRDLKTLPETVKGEEVLNWINELSIAPKSARYDEKGNKYQQGDYERFKENLNIGKIEKTINVEYGLTVRRTQLRTWPSIKPSFSSAANQQYDYFTETAVYAAEPVLIYHVSADGLWYFAEIYNYKGWIPAKDVALCSKEELADYRAPKDFLVVKVPVLFTPESYDKRVSQLQLDMGVTLPVLSKNSSGYEINYPVCNENNYLEFIKMTIPYSEDASTGFLDYTVENVLIQAFRFLGEPYGWGGMNNARDCSAFVADVYRSFGIVFPRNSDQQEKMKGSVSFNGKNRTERLKILDSLKPGTPLYMPGHAMIYLGKWQDRHYIIHDVPAVYQKGTDDKLTPVRLNQVSVTPLDICNSKGLEYLMLLTTAVDIE